MRLRNTAEAVSVLQILSPIFQRRNVIESITAFIIYFRLIQVLHVNKISLKFKLSAKGLFSANLGGNLFKVRIAGPSSGKRSGFRTIIAYKKGERLIFIYGFAKNEQDNIDAKELDSLKKLSKDYLLLSSSELEKAIKIGILIELED